MLPIMAVENDWYRKFKFDINCTIIINGTFLSIRIY